MDLKERQENNLIEANIKLMDRVKDLEFDLNTYIKRNKMVQKRLLDFMNADEDLKEIINDCIDITKGEYYE